MLVKYYTHSLSIIYVILRWPLPFEVEVNTGLNTSMKPLRPRSVRASQAVKFWMIVQIHGIFFLNMYCW